MSQLGNNPAENATVTSQSQTLDKYWCFMCEREFNHAKVDSAEVFCPECNCISELIETENDPRSFRPFDARSEAPQTTQNTQANTASSGQTNQNAIPQRPQPQMNAPLGINVVYQTMMGPMRSINIQNFFSQPVPNQINQNGGISQPQINPVQNQPGAPQQNQNVPPGGANLFNPLMNNVFGMFNSMLSGASMQGGFLDMNSQIIEEFLRNDPNRHGPPPAPEESINRLKKSKYGETCKVKDCPVCQEDYKNGDNILTLPCDHIFHKDCAETWLKMHNSCPSCRKPLTQPRDSYSENMFA